MPSTLRILRVQGPDGSGVPPESAFTRDVQVGRSIESDLCLPDATVSRRHATLLVRQGLWYVVDQGSTAGTFLNRQRLEPATPTELRANDVLEFGPWAFRIKDDGTVTRTIDLSHRETGAVEVPITSRRLDALGGYMGALGRAESAEELAESTIEAALGGTGFRRGAVLLPPSGEGEPPEFYVGRVAGPRGGGFAELSPEGFAPSSRLIARALEGRSALFSAPDGGGTLDHSVSLAADSIMAALCVPVMRDGSVASLLYFDTRGAPGGVGDAVGYCEDIAGLYAFALTSRANADFAQRQHAMRVEFEHARELREMLSSPEARAGSGYSHAHKSVAGMFVSADFFDVVHHDDGSMHAVFGDAAGHGLGASMLSTLIHAHLIALLRSGMGTLDAVRETNRFVSSKATAGRFVSLVVAEFRADGTLAMVDAGHGHWAHTSPDGTEAPEGARSVPVGVDPDATFELIERSVSPGDRLVLYTDGITEQENGSGEAFGVARLLEAVGASGSCGEDVSGVYRALMSHAEGRLIEDDATIASVEVLG